MDTVLTPKELQNKKKARLVSIVYSTIVLMLLIYPFITYLNPPPGQEGIMVNLGVPDEGQGTENAPKQEAAPPIAETETEESTPPEVIEPQPDPTPEPKREKPTETKDVVKTEDPAAIALRKKKEKERQERAEQRRKEDAAKRAAEAKAEAKRKAEAEQKRQAEAERARKAKEAADLKAALGGGFGGGRGNTGTDGNQGDPNGDPNADALEGISVGAGKIGGGLQNRGARPASMQSECSNKSGRVVIRVCVNESGKVTSAEYQLSGSTTQDNCLRTAAIRNARQWGFTDGSVEKQCGTITYDFKVK